MLNVSKLTTIQLEWGTRVLSEVASDSTGAMPNLMLCAVMLADTDALLAARKDPSALDPFIREAAEVPADESEEAVSGFFERWRAYQMRIGRSAGMMVEAGPMPTPKPSPVTLSPALAAAMEQ